MSDETNPDEGEGIKSLRKQYDAMKKEKDEMAERLSKFEAAHRTATVAETLKAKGIPETAASLYSGDDTSPEAVSKWVEQYADLFGGAKAPAENSPPDPNAQAAARVSQASFGHPEAPSPQGNGQVLGDPAEIRRGIESAASYDDLVKNYGFPPLAGGLYVNPARR